LDVLRGASRDRDGVHGVLTDLARETQGLPGVKAAKQRIEVGLAKSDAETSARAVTQDFATLATVAALARSAPAAIVEAFARTRLARSSLVVGAAELSSECGELLARALPTG
ncbi:MAG: DNA alkylation response protein, partial [Hyphomicrobiales bacterium]|nr:DNA alkylation response protein [Hyphomicrobiales bacterium]